MPRQSMVNSDVKSSKPTGSVLEFTERVSCEASANSFQEVMKAKIAAEAMPGPASGNSTCQNACQVRAAVDLRRLGEVARHLTKESVDQPDGERHVERDVGQDQPKVRVDESSAREDDEKRQRQRDARHGSRQHEAQEQRRLPLEAVSGRRRSRPPCQPRRR